MTKREALRQAMQQHTLTSLGFTPTEADTLRRISLTLSRWAEHECNGTIERDETRGNRPYWSSPGSGRHYVAPVADRERGAMKRLQAIFSARVTRESHPDGTRSPLWLQSALSYYVQGDPRGVALYIIRPGDVPTGADVDSHYSRGVAVY